MRVGDHHLLGDAAALGVVDDSANGALGIGGGDELVPLRDQMHDLFDDRHLWLVAPGILRGHVGHDVDRHVDWQPGEEVGVERARGRRQPRVSGGAEVNGRVENAEEDFVDHDAGGVASYEVGQVAVELLEVAIDLVDGRLLDPEGEARCQRFASTVDVAAAVSAGAGAVGGATTAVAIMEGAAATAVADKQCDTDRSCERHLISSGQFAVPGGRGSKRRSSAICRRSGGSSAPLSPAAHNPNRRGGVETPARWFAARAPRADPIGYNLSFVPVWVVISLLVALQSGCLSAPEPRDGPDGLAFPPDSLLQIGRLQVIDLDQDGADDFVLTSRSSQHKGIFVLLSRDGAVGSQYHQFIPIVAMDPLGARVVDGDGDGTLDLFVFGQNWDTRSYLIGFPGRGDGTFADPVTAETSAELIPGESGDPVSVDVGAFFGDGSRHVVVGDGNDMRVAAWPGWTQAEFESLDFVDVRGPSGDIWTGLSAIRAVRDATDSRDLLLVVSGNYVNVVLPDGALGFSAPEIHTTAKHTDAVGLVRLDFLDVDGDGAVEVIGGEGANISAVSPWPVDQPYNRASWLDASVTALRAADFDGDGDEEIVTLMDDGTLTILPNARFGADTITTDSPSVHAFDTAYEAAVLGVGDFDGNGDREIVVFSTTGTPLCFGYVALAAPQGC